jgi:polyisoprenoid-binding protein YceI
MKKTVLKRALFFLLLMAAARIVSAQYKPVDQGSAVSFRIGNFGFDVTGTFGGLQGGIDFDPQDPANSHFDVSIEAGTVNTDNGLRDKHLKDEGYFDVKNYPRIRLVSGKVTPGGPSGQYMLTGQLTIKDKTKAISFPFSASSSADGYIFKGSLKINRKDFGVGGTSTISNELTLSMEVHVIKK